MKVTMKLYASLGRYLPEGAKYNEVVLDVGEHTTILELLDGHNVPRESCHLVLLNGVFQPPAARSETRLNEADAVAVWPPVAGG